MTTLATLRWWLLGVLSLGLAGTLVELVLTEHYEDGWQMVPIAVAGAALGAVAWHAVRPDGVNIRVVQLLMVAVMVVGAVGVGLHFNGAAEFQREIDPTQSGWPLFAKVMRVKAPPMLAPGLMTQLGALGLVYVYFQRSIYGSRGSD